MKKILERGARAFAALLALISVGCSTISEGTKAPLRVATIPAGARVMISTANGEIETATTPHTFIVPKKHEVQVDIDKEGYEPLSVVASPYRSQLMSIGKAGAIAAIPISPLVGLGGLGVDRITGANNTFDAIEVTLNPLPPRPIVTNHVAATVSPSPIAVMPAPQVVTNYVVVMEERWVSSNVVGVHTLPAHPPTNIVKSYDWNPLPTHTPLAVPATAGGQVLAVGQSSASCTENDWRNGKGVIRVPGPRQK